MAWYNAGTVSVANNSVDVTGNLTSWVDNVDAGQAFIGPDGFPYEIASITSATALKLRRPYRGATAAGQAYTIMPAQGYVMALARAAAELVQSFASVRDGIGQGVFPAGSVATPGFRFDGDENTGITQTGPDTVAIVVAGQVVANFNANGFSPERMLLGDGTLAAPAMGFISDPDTGLWHPAANALGLVAGGVEHLRAVGGKVGVGVTPASHKLEVGGNIFANGVLYSSPAAGTFPALNLVSKASGSWKQTINFSNNATQKWEMGVDASNNGNNNFYWYDNAAGTERMRIDSSGNVGIGTSAPQGKQHILSGSRAPTTSGFMSGGVVSSSSAGGPAIQTGHNESGNYNWINSAFTNNAGIAATYYVMSGGVIKTLVNQNDFGVDVNIVPMGDNIRSIGWGGGRFKDLFVTSGVINTSDENAKIIEENGGLIPDEWLDAWGAVQWCRYKFKDAVEGKGGDARWHVGLIAQRVRDAFAALDLDATEIGLLCYDEWDEEREPIMEERQIDTETVVVGQEATGLFLANGEPHMRDITEERPIMGMIDTGETRVTLPAGNRWGLRYDECQAMEAAWQRRELARKDAAIAALENEMASMSVQLAALVASGSN